MTLTIGLRNFAASAPPDWRHLLDQARAADDAGIDRVFVVDHLAFGPDLSSYGDPGTGGLRGGRQPTGPDGDWLEPLTVLSAVAAVTTRVRLATNILVAGLRHPVVLAKTVATLDALAHGRFELGVGVGWQRAEYDAVGVDFDTRGQVLDEVLDVCATLWTDRAATFHGDRVSFTDLHMMPKPDDLPVWVGGRAIRGVARRVARHASGWNPWGTGVDTITDTISRMRDLVAQEGGDLDRVEISHPLPTVVTDAGELDLPAMFAPVPALRAAGVRDFRIVPRLPPDHAGTRDLLDRLRAAYTAAG
ncbi:hypothetical protein BLA60_30845 [Actinophytocola xinjiangensis]|uniref:Luciferase-like domain-containing protein n=1 Tax=Actinophytocola xinjiangensis TaxID=485602 RepID=A0A7Z0WGI7_9PSEU|nr:TIGR03619 family F420-dependent LLM class oxidoreductase [Actinophytocola xinjiangensis]OLF06663.1 hypothetical protein BLA60_30845 [Actinophytocola xinjiangensis]